MGVQYSAISLAASGRTNSSAGYYWRLVGDNNKVFSKKTKRWKRQIIKCDLQTGEPLEEYESASAAARALGKDGKNGGSSIIMACKGKYHQAYGFKWKYKD